MIFCRTKREHTREGPGAAFLLVCFLAFHDAWIAHPHFPELILNFLPSQLPCIDLRQAFAQLLKFFLNAVLLARSPHPQELIFIGVFTQAKRERVRMVPLQRGAGRYRDKSWKGLLAGRRALPCGYAMRLTDSFAFSSLVEQALHV